YATRLDALPITEIDNAQSDLVNYTNATDPGIKQHWIDRFKSVAGGTNFLGVAAKFNDLLNSPGLTIIQHLARTQVGSHRFYTRENQQVTVQVFDYLDGLQVTAMMLGIEYEHQTLSEATAQFNHGVNASRLAERRKTQLERTPIPLPAFWG